MLKCYSYDTVLKIGVVISIYVTAVAQPSRQRGADRYTVKPLQDILLMQSFQPRMLSENDMLCKERVIVARTVLFPRG